jgi:hypothetical protein
MSPRPGTDVQIVDEAPRGFAVLDTGQAFFVGAAAMGSTDAYEEVHSMPEYERKLGPRAGYAVLYDSLSAYFSEGGSTAYVARAVGTGAAAATGDLGTSLTVDAASAGTWANTVTVTAEAPLTFAVRLGLVAAPVATSEVPEGSVADVVAWVGSDPQRARAAIEAEQARETPRQTLLDTLEPVAQGAELAEPQAAGDPIQLVVRDGTEILERSPTLADQDAAVAWGTGASYVRVAIKTPGLLPDAATTVALAGGADGAAVDAGAIAAALERLPYALGPGQVCAPGQVTTAVHTELLEHADAKHRVALLDLPDVADSSALAAAVEGLESAAGVRYGAAFAPWVLYPGPGGATVTIPYSAVQAGLIARSDAASENPNLPAAGINGISRHALGLTQTYTDAQREALNEVGVTLAIERYGTVRTYGARSAAGPDEEIWRWFSGAREVMAIAHEADAIAENYVLSQIDGQRTVFASLNGDLVGMLLEHYTRGALFGPTPAEAFAVDTGEQINTTETIVAGEIHAVIRVKTSPTAEWVSIEIVRPRLETPLTAAA